MDGWMDHRVMWFVPSRFPPLRHLFSLLVPLCRALGLVYPILRQWVRDCGLRRADVIVLLREIKAVSQPSLVLDAVTMGAIY